MKLFIIGSSINVRFFWQEKPTRLPPEFIVRSLTYFLFDSYVIIACIDLDLRDLSPH